MVSSFSILDIYVRTYLRKFTPGRDQWQLAHIIGPRLVPYGNEQKHLSSCQISEAVLDLGLWLD